MNTTTSEKDRVSTAPKKLDTSNEKSVVRDESAPAKGQEDRSLGDIHARTRDEVLSAPEDEPEVHLDPAPLSGDGPDGPVYSVFSTGQKRFIVSMAACAGFFSPLSASIYFPALNILSREFKVSSTLINLTLTTYMIFQGLAPMIFGDLADTAGRRPAYVIGFVVYISACIGLALQKSYAALMVLRCLQSTGSSGTIALSSGVVADVAPPSERGVYMGWVTSGPMVAPTLGPVLGGVFAQYLGWRAIFWFLAIAAGVYLIPFLVFFPETGRNVVGNGGEPPQGWSMSLMNYLEMRKQSRHQIDRESGDSAGLGATGSDGLRKKTELRWPNPLNTLRIVAEKDVGLLLFFSGLLYTAFYDVIASMPYFFEKIYGLNDIQIGLAYLPFGIGSMIAPAFFGRTVDWNYARLARKHGLRVDRSRGDDLTDFPLELARIQVALPILLVGNTALLVYGWVLEAETHLAVPLVLQCITGVFMIGAFNVMSVLLVDLYPLSPSTATAANNLVRCLMGAGGTAVIIEMVEAMGRGWCFTFIALVIFATSPVLVVLVRKGPRWRRIRLAATEERQAQTS